MVDEDIINEVLSIKNQLKGSGVSYEEYILLDQNRNLEYIKDRLRYMNQDIIDINNDTLLSMNDYLSKILTYKL